MAKQVWSNNASTYLSSQAGVMDTTIIVDDISDFKTLLVDEFELVTLTNGTEVEIVKVTDKLGNVWTVARAQEGTTAIIWPAGTLVEARLTAGTLDVFVQQDELQSGLDGVNIQVGQIDATGTLDALNFLNGGGSWSKIPTGSLNATGTPSATSYLRGDGSWSNITLSSIASTGTASATTFLRGDGLWDPQILTRLQALEDSVDDHETRIADLEGA